MFVSPSNSPKHQHQHFADDQENELTVLHANPMIGHNNDDITKDGSNNPVKIIVLPSNVQFSVNENTNEIVFSPVVQIPEVHLITCQQTNVSEQIDNVTNNTINTIKDEKVAINELCKVDKTFKENGEHSFLKGCKWSPDGLCLLTASDDYKLRLFEFPEVIDASSIQSKQCSEPVLSFKEGGTVYDYTWYPLMNSTTPETCVYACTSQDSPIHLWDAYDGSLRATYQCINQYDEVTSAFSLCFSPDGSKLYAGLKKGLSVFNVAVPGRICTKRNLKSPGDYIFQTNIISAIAINPYMHSIYALGSYDKSIGIYTEPEGSLQCVLQGHKGGITHIIFSSDGTKMYTGGRRDPEILCWDLRNPGQVLFSIKRKVDTNQRIYFDLASDGRNLITGNTNGTLDMYAVDGVSDTDPVLLASVGAHADCVNGASFHPNQNIIATSSGQRHIRSDATDSGSDDSDNNDDRVVYENSVKIWNYTVL